MLTGVNSCMYRRRCPCTRPCRTRPRRATSRRGCTPAWGGCGCGEEVSKPACADVCITERTEKLVVARARARATLHLSAFSGRERAGMRRRRSPRELGHAAAAEWGWGLGARRVPESPRVPEGSPRVEGRDGGRKGGRGACLIRPDHRDKFD